jgi:hypothetical protein
MLVVQCYLYFFGELSRVGMTDISIPSPTTFDNHYRYVSLRKSVGVS